MINLRKNKVKKISLMIVQSGKVGVLFIKRLAMITVNATYNIIDEKQPRRIREVTRISLLMGRDKVALINLFGGNVLQQALLQLTVLEKVTTTLTHHLERVPFCNYSSTAFQPTRLFHDTFRFRSV